MTTIVALYGGPGCGKSTLAAAVYTFLKQRDVSCELVREYVKAWAWRGDKIRKYDELYLLAKQLREESNVYGRVQYVITDRPLNMSAVYDRHYGGFGLMVDNCKRLREIQVADGLKHVDLIVRREKAYVVDGRFENEQDAVKIDELTRSMFDLIDVSTVEDVIRAIERKDLL